MFTFIHTADIHLDSPLRGLSRHEGAPEDEIRGATRKALVNIVDLALERHVDFVVIAGDLYDGDWPDYSTGQFFTQQMRRLRDARILVYLITGNHDAESKVTKSLILPDNVTQFSTKKPESVSHPAHPVTLHGQGFANQAQQENLAVNYPAPDPDRFNIGILHTSLAGNVDHDTYAPCSIAEINTKNYHYWALGHIHLRSIVQESPPIIFPGNPQGRHIKETGERGCYVISVDDNLDVTHTEFVATDVVRWTHVSIDITDIEAKDDVLEKVRSATQKLLAEINESDRLQLAAFRITLTGATELHGQLHTELKNLQADCHEITQDQNPEALWLERVRLKTSPLYQLETLAERDELAAQVIGALEKFDPATSVPSNVTKLKNKLGGVAQTDLDAFFSPETDEQKQQLSEDVAAIVLQSITHSAQ